MSLHELQTRVHVGKDKRNEFGGYNYRTAEGILAAIKAALPEGATITCTDTLQELAGQIFVTATAHVRFADGSEASAQGHAMHPLTKKGMDPSQITGAASSYARKYALAGLMALDDGSVDPDAAKQAYEPEPQKPATVSVEEAAILTDLATRAGTDRAAVFKAMKLEGDSWADLPAEWFPGVRKKMQAKIDQMDMEHDAATRPADPAMQAPDAHEYQ